MRLTFVFYSYAALILFSCREGAVGPFKSSGMDTTGHRYSFAVDTIGISGSELHAVKIAGGDEFWAFGEIHTAQTDQFDTSGNWIPPYNALRWYEKEYSFHRIYYEVSSDTDALILGIQNILFKSASDIWIAAGSVFHYDGSVARISLNRFDLNSTLLRSVWQSSDGDIWAGGTKGVLVFYDGAAWQRFPLSFAAAINDIWGSKEEICLVASGTPEENKNRILRISGLSQTDTIAWPSEKSLSGIWFERVDNYYVSGAGVYYSKGGAWVRVSEPGYYYKIRGSAENNIFAVGTSGSCLHFSGTSWKFYGEFEFNGALYNLDVTENFVVAVGYVDDSAIIVRGKSDR